MSMNPYTMNMLYQKGILDYVPYDLMDQSPIPSGVLNGQNNYLTSAMQGNLYQQYGNTSDNFSYSTSNGGYYDTQIGSQSGITTNGFFGENGNGSNSNNGIKSIFGFNGIGSQSDAGITMFGESGIGGNSGINRENIHGGFSDVKNSLSNGFNQTLSTVSALPTMTKGFIAAGLILLTMCGMFRSHKKHPKTAKIGFWSKIFKKKQPEPVKTSFWDKVKKCLKK